MTRRSMLTARRTTTFFAVFTLACAAVMAMPGCDGAAEPEPIRATSDTDTGPAPFRTGGSAPAPAPAPRPSGPPSDPTVAEFSGLRAPVPATWVWQPPQGSMRAANYVLPALEEGNQAQLVVFHNIGGGRDMNIDRWKGQFRTADLRPVEPVITEHEVSGMTMTIVEMTGEYQRMGQAWFTPQQTFIAAILEAPGGDLQIRLDGDTDTVNAHREDFMRFLMGIELAGDIAPSGGSSGY